jgi:pimeloyl-ACP methyl ester carboxylesterase
MTEKFQAKDWAKGVQAPVLAFYALDDWVIPNKFSLAQIKNFSGPVTVEALEDAGHNSMRRRQKKRYYEAVERFINSVALCR